jgi:hypothetical protein
LAEKSKKYKKATFATAEAKRKKTEQRFLELHRAWSQLVK